MKHKQSRSGIQNATSGSVRRAARLFSSGLTILALATGVSNLNAATLEQAGAVKPAPVGQPKVTFAGEKPIRVNGFDMAVVEQGSGPTLILLHGGVADSRTWKTTIPKLANDFRVVAPTMRYYGKQDWSEHWPAFSNDLLSDDIAALIRKVSDQPVHLVGWSRGARIAHKVALAHPELVRSIYLFEGTASLKLTPDQAREEGAFNKKYWSGLRPAFEKGGVDALLHEFIDLVHGDGVWEGLSPETVTMLRENAGIYRVDPQAPKTFYPCEHFGRSPVPTRLVYGTASTEPFQRQRKLAESCMPEGSVTVIEKATHMWPRLETDAFVESVRRFAKSH